MNISKYIGNHGKQPSLILNTKINSNTNNKIQKKFTRIKKNIYKLSFSNSSYSSITLFVKLVKKK